MKKVSAIIVAILSCITLAACGGTKDYVLNEKTFFLVMTNMLWFPQQYSESNIELDCFTYELKDVEGKSYMCGVRQCSSGYGCQCGNDTIIGFILEYDGEIPAPKNQSNDNPDKTWIHIKGKLKSPEMTTITIQSYLSDGTPDPDNTEEVLFLEFIVESCDLIDDYSNLNFYVS